jgi:hypothetical protein
LRCCRLRKSKHQGNHRDEYGEPACHSLNPSKGSPESELNGMGAIECPSSLAGQIFRANSTYGSSCLNKIASGLGTFVPGRRRAATA